MRSKQIHEYKQWRGKVLKLSPSYDQETIAQLYEFHLG